MAKICIYAIYDKDAEQFNEKTLQAPNDAVAIRVIKNSQKKDEMLNENADRYELHYSGRYDSETGAIENVLDENGNPTTKLVHKLEMITSE